MYMTGLMRHNSWEWQQGLFRW